MKLSLWLALVLAVPVFAGVRIQLESPNSITGEVTKGEILLDGDRLRINETGKDTNNSTLFLTDGGRNRIVTLNKTKNEYEEMDQQTMNQMMPLMQAQAQAQMAQTQAQMAQLQAQMKNMPPEQRAAMEKMMAQMKGLGTPAAPAPLVFTAKGRGSANGFACTKYEGNRGAEKVYEVCAASPSDLKFAASDFQVYEKMKEFMAGLLGKMSPLMGAGYAAALNTLGFPGFPVQEIKFNNGTAGARTDAKTIERATFSNADFSLGSAKKVDPLQELRGKQ
jgi:hypothetical protein